MTSVGKNPSVRKTTRLPDGLQRLSDPPKTLWWKGQLPGGPGVAIVGTRACTAYGRRVAFSLGKAVAGAGWPVISGLARGVDAAAHRGTVAASGSGYAVFGSGIDVIYPSENFELADELVATGGGVLSEYPPGTPPAPFRFPARNRIIAALSAAVVVVEAGEKGGALITARIALELGIDVLAVPGDIDRPVSTGCNLLIRDGAHPVLSAADLIDSLEMILGPAPKDSPSQRPRASERATVDLDEILNATDEPVGRVLADLMRAELEGSIRPTGD
jgi:DNA processing protein